MIDCRVTSSIYLLVPIYTPGWREALGELSVPKNPTQRSWPGARFSKAPETCRARKAKAKSQTLPLQSSFIPIFLIWRELHFIQEVSRVYTSPFLDTDEQKMALRKMALWTREVSETFEKRTPGLKLWPLPLESSAQTLRPLHLPQNISSQVAP